MTFAHAALLPEPAQGTRIALIGGGLGENLQYDGWFEAMLQSRFADRQLVVRNLCFPGDMPSYRPRAGRNSPWAFPGAETFRPETAAHAGDGVEPSPDKWLTMCKADVVLAFFGYNESFDGPDFAERYRKELEAFVDHTLRQRYNGASAPKLVLVSPIAFEDLSAKRPLPDGREQNENLARYAGIMREVAAAKQVGFIDCFTPSREWMKQGTMTSNGFLPTADGDRKLAEFLTAELFEGDNHAGDVTTAESLRAAVIDKDWFFRNDYRILNGVHVYGRRRAPYGTMNYPEEIEKTRQMTANRDRNIWMAARGEKFDLAQADRQTRPLTPIASNSPKEVKYLDESDALAAMKLADGFKAELFASEQRFPELRNPVQMSFDNKGRLWVAVAPSYPHYKPGDPKPNDKILILEDTDHDGKADKQTVFADGLQMPFGMEFAPEGLYVAQQPDLVLLRDTDGDDRADVRETVLRGFDSHDSHHSINAFSADASGAIYLAEGVFLHTQVETAYGPRRGVNAGIWRFDPRTQRLERYSQAHYANPWGIAFDDWDQCFVADASSGMNWWALPLSAKAPHGVQIGFTEPFAPKRARPTSGSEFISSRHFPDELQGGYMVNNVIGFLGTSIHDIRDDGSGFAGKLRQDLVWSTDPNYRPCDLEFAPDGSLYIVDWHNALIGHMQHSARDPKRDRDHGRIYRVTYSARPLVNPPVIAGAKIEELLDVLKVPEYRTRYRARRELRGRNADEVRAAVKGWVAALDAVDPRFEHHLCEALWVTWGTGVPDHDLLDRCLKAKSYQARTAAVEVLRAAWREVPDHAALLMAAANDAHPRVRLAAIVAASWVGGADGARVAAAALRQPIDSWMPEACRVALMSLREPLQELVGSGKLKLKQEQRIVADFLAGKDLAGVGRQKTDEPKLPQPELALYRLGKEVYHREAHCATCHQKDGMGDGVYPPLAGSEWVLGDETRLTKVVLKGLFGQISVKGKSYDPKNGVPPMTPFEYLLKDDELAGVLTYIRNSHGNTAPPVKVETVRRIRAELIDKKDFFTAEELLKQHPFPTR